MDTTLEYIKMCDCEEIQNQCPFKEGDFILNKSAIAPPNGFLFVNYSYQPNDNNPEWELLYKLNQKVDFNIWLPRQDQLQEMFKTYSPGERHRRFYSFTVDHQIWERYGSYISLEKVWLFFIMWSLHWKKWNGEAWEK